MQTLLDVLSIELVLTAHPTESRRRTVISKLQRLARLLDRLSGQELSVRRQKKARDSIRAEVVSLWLTDRHRTARLAVTDEVRTGLYFVSSVFWEALPIIYDDLEDALAIHYPDLKPPTSWLRLASWMGGDRDGNPNVTHRVTAETLRLHRGLAVEKHRESLQNLARHLSMSDHRLPPPLELTDWIESRRPFPPHAAFIEERYVAESYRLVLSLLAGDHRVAGFIKNSLQYYNEANTLFLRIKDRFGIAYSYCGIGNAYRRMKDYRRSLFNFSKAVTLYPKIGDKVSYAYTLWSLGTTYKMAGNFQKARDNFMKAMLLFRRTKDARGIIYCSLGIGEIDFLSGRKATSVKRLGMAFHDAVRNSFAVEKCHAASLLSYVNKNNPLSPPFSRGGQGGFSEKTDNACYNRLGLKIKFQGLPFNIP